MSTPTSSNTLTISELYSQLLGATRNFPEFCGADDPYINFEIDVETMPREDGAELAPIAQATISIDTDERVVYGEAWKLGDDEREFLREEPYLTRCHEKANAFLERLRPLIEPLGVHVQIMERTPDQNSPAN